MKNVRGVKAAVEGRVLHASSPILNVRFDYPSMVMLNGVVFFHSSSFGNPAFTIFKNNNSLAV